MGPQHERVLRSQHKILDWSREISKSPVAKRRRMMSPEKLPQTKRMLRSNHTALNWSEETSESSFDARQQILPPCENLMPPYQGEIQAPALEGDILHSQSDMCLSEPMDEEHAEIDEFLRYMNA